MARVELPKSRLKEKRKKRKRILIALGCGFFVSIIGIIIGFTWLPFLRIQVVEVEGSKTVRNDTIENVVYSQLSGAYLHVFARSNIFLYPTSAIKQELLTSFPTLVTVRVRAKSLQRIGVSVVERQPVALWCGGKMASSSGCFLIDSAGVVYAPAVMYAGDAYQKYYGVVIGNTLPQQFLDPGLFHSLQSLVDALQKKVQLQAQAISVLQDNDVSVTFENGFSLRTSLSANQGDMFEHFDLALQAAPFAVHKLSDFEYLDLRFGDKLYYKLKNSVTATTTAVQTKLAR